MPNTPNIVYILADDMGYGDLSCLNADSKIATVNLDRMATQGMRFGDAHSTSAVCTPSRYSILTGRYNWRSWLKSGVTWGDSPPLIEPGRMTVASLLRANGYKTGCIGKWHLGWTWGIGADGAIDFAEPISDGPTTVGLDYFFGISASLDMPPYVYVENDRVTALPDRVIPAGKSKGFWREGLIAPDFQHDQVLQRTTEKAVAFMEQACSEQTPFLLYFPLTAPHTPILPAPEFAGRSATNAYGDFCLQVDDVVGQVLAALDRLGIADNTIVIFTADNGCSPEADFEELARAGHHPSYVFRGHKADIYEGGHRVPLLLRWPGKISPGGICDATVCLVDLLATCAEMLGQRLPENAGEDSVSSLSLWLGKPESDSHREATVHHSFDGSFSIRAGRWKLEMCPGSGGWSFPKPGAESEGLPPVQLYDLQADVGERRNVQAEHPDVVAHLSELLARYVRDGRSTPGTPQRNHPAEPWPGLWWLSAPPSDAGV